MKWHTSDCYVPWQRLTILGLPESINPGLSQYHILNPVLPDCEFSSGRSRITPHHAPGSSWGSRGQGKVSLRKRSCKCSLANTEHASGTQVTEQQEHYPPKKSKTLKVAFTLVVPSLHCHLSQLWCPEQRTQIKYA